MTSPRRTFSYLQSGHGRSAQTRKAYIYLPMGFALLVEVLQMRYEHNRRKRLDGRSDLEVPLS